MSDELTWTKVEGTRIRIGLRQSFVQSYSVSFIELLPIGSDVEEGAALALVQGKAHGDEFELESPVAGRIVSLNAEVNVTDSPALLNSDPEGAGWLVVVDPAR